MKRLERLKEQRAAAFRKYAEICTREPMKARMLKMKMDLLDEEIAEAETYKPKALSEQFPPEELSESGLLEDMIKTHVAADFYCDAVMTFREKMDKMGLADCSLYPVIRNIEKLSAEYAALICHPEYAGLQDFLTTNSYLIDGLHGKCNAYMKKHLRKKIIDGRVKFFFKE